nr:MAG TPA: Transcriptional regulator, RHH-like, CopG [Caudoviricetes sp.]
MRVKPDLNDRLVAYCQENGLSKSQFLTLAIDTLTKPAQ